MTAPTSTIPLPRAASSSSLPLPSLTTPPATLPVWWAASGKKTINRGTNLATGALRQPGSSIKPLTAYGPAMEMGLLSPISVLADYPYQVMGGKAWPVNVDGRYRGQVTVTEALQWSYNTVAVRTVAMVTPAKAYEFATQRFHLQLESGRMVNGEMKSDIDLSPLSMGGLTDGVTTRQMANAFAVFPENGIYREARTYTKVEDSQGNVILDNTREDEVAVKESTAYYMNTMLQNVVQNGGGSEARISGMTWPVRPVPPTASLTAGS